MSRYLRFTANLADLEPRFPMASPVDKPVMLGPQGDLVDQVSIQQILDALPLATLDIGKKDFGMKSLID